MAKQAPSHYETSLRTSRSFYMHACLHAYIYIAHTRMNCMHVNGAGGARWDRVGEGRTDEDDDVTTSLSPRCHPPHEMGGAGHWGWVVRSGQGGSCSHLHDC